MYKGARWPREAPPLLRQGRHYDRRRSQRGRRVERLVVVVAARAPFYRRVHVVAEERPGALYINSEREEGREDDDATELPVAGRSGAPEHKHEAPDDRANITARSYYSGDAAQRRRATSSA